jgi:hypothetical protein
LALPEGVEFDPTQEGVSVTLSSASGVLFAATAATADLTTTASGRAKAQVAADVPSSGNVRLVLKPSKPELTYALRLSAKELSTMSGGGTTMDLRVQVGDTILSQSLTFREKKSHLVYP